MERGRPMAMRGKIDPIRIMCYIFIVIFVLTISWICVQESKGAGEYKYKSFHPKPGTVGKKATPDLGTVAVTSYLPFTAKICMGLENTEFRTCAVFRPMEMWFFYGVSRGRHVVAWSALSYDKMDSGAAYVIIKHDDLYLHWFDRMQKTKDLRSDQLIGMNLPYFGIDVDMNKYRNPNSRRDRT